MVPITVGDLYDRSVQFYGKQTAISYGDFSCTYSKMGDNAFRLATAFQNIGLKKGDNIAFFMSNCPEYIFCEYALAKIGCARVPLAVLLGSDDHVYMMNLTECKILIYHEKMVDRVKEMIPRLKTVTTFICVGEDLKNVTEGHYHLQSMIDEYPPEPVPVEIAPEDMLAIYFTGGTTGKPKGVMLSHKTFVNTVMAEMLEFDIGWNEVFAYIAPLTHGGGALLLPVLLRKGRCVILDHFDPTLFLKAVEKEQITSTFLVPTMIYVLLDFPELKDYNTSSLSNIIYGASAIAPERLKQALNIFGPVFTQLFGQTEAPMAISALTKEAHVVADPKREKEIFSSAGRPTLHTQLKLIDEKGNLVKPGQSGEVVVRCSNIMDGYYKNPEATSETIINGWLHTGDIARQDEEGFLYIVDRKKDMIVSGGFNIFPREIEDVLFEYPGVKGVAVIGVPNEKWGEEVKALVTLQDGHTITQTELIAFVKERKGSLMAPKTIEFLDQIPLTNLGKIDKKKIRAEYWKDRDRMVF